MMYSTSIWGERMNTQRTFLIDAILMPNINSLNELPFVDINRLSNSE